MKIPCKECPVMAMCRTKYFMDLLDCSRLREVIIAENHIASNHMLLHKEVFLEVCKVLGHKVEETGVDIEDENGTPLRNLYTSSGMQE